MHRPEQIRGAGDVSQRQLEEKLLSGLAFGQVTPDGGVVCGAVLDGVIEDRRVRREPRHGELVDVTLERAFFQQIACNVVEPEALAQIVKQLGCFHRVTSVSWPCGTPAKISTNSV